MLNIEIRLVQKIDLLKKLKNYIALMYSFLIFFENLFNPVAFDPFTISKSLLLIILAKWPYASLRLLNTLPFLFIDNKLKVIQDDMNLHIIMNQTEIKKIRKIANDSNQDIQTLKDLDPNSKNTQRIIRTLTDKLHKLDQIFKSMKLVDGV